MQKRYIFGILGIMSVSLFSCEDEVDLDLESSDPQLVVDAFLDNAKDTQEIKLTYSTDFFNKDKPSPVTDATVLVSDDKGGSYNFDYNPLTESYLWIAPTTDDSIATEGNIYDLTITHKESVYKATELCNRVTPIDSIEVEYKVNPFSFSAKPEKGYFATLFATDMVGAGDMTWIKVYKNNKIYDTLNQTGASISYDGSLGETGGPDGLLWIPPIRASITPNENYYNIGDQVRIEHYSINIEAFRFLTQAQTQKGNVGLFASPPGNINYNVFSEGTTAYEVIGIFNIGLKTDIEFTIQETDYAVIK